jgi:hypothetical protein
MVTANGVRDPVKNTQQKEEKMNARKVLCGVCVLVVGLLVLESAALAGPPSVEYWVGERPVYGANGNPVAPKVVVPLYRAEDSKPPGFLRSWTSAAVSVPSVVRYVTWNDLLVGEDLPDNVAPLVTYPPYVFSDPVQVGGYDPWDPLGNSFGLNELSATVDDGVWDDDGVPNNRVTPEPWGPFEWSDPLQQGGSDPWDPLGNSFGLVK